MADLEKLMTVGASELSPLIPRAATIVSPQKCRQHLKLLRCFRNLQETTSETKGLFKTEYAHDISNEADAKIRQAIIKERRWSIYLARAIYRFSIWWCWLPASHPPSRPSNQTLEKPDLHGPSWWDEDKMPPLDILMVLHALMLHSRAFGGDCLRHGKMRLWKEGFPLELASQCIEQGTLAYTYSEAAKQNLERTGLAWDNIQDPDNILVECFRCQKQTQVPWTTRRHKGLADSGFAQQCRFCKFVLTRNSLLVQKLRRDVHSLLEEDVPLPGSYRNVVDGLRGTASSEFATNEALQHFLLEQTRPTNLFPEMDLIVETSFKVAGVKDVSALHDVFSHYQYVNSSSCNLHAAVTRVLEWTSAIDRYDWSHTTDIHSPQTETQYSKALGQWSKSSCSVEIRNTADDILLVWATHQLAPSAYNAFARGICNGKLVDWEPAHKPATCKVCQMLQPSSFARRFFQSIGFPAAWISHA